jgi:hypothetical protein
MNISIIIVPLTRPLSSPPRKKKTKQMKIKRGAVNREGAAGKMHKIKHTAHKSLQYHDS